MDDVQILGIAGSPRKGATSKAMQACLSAAAEVPGTQTTCVDLAGKKINCCLNCGRCSKEKLGYCPVFKDDFVKEYHDLYLNCDAIILASPIYQFNSTGLLQNFLSRMRPLGSLSRSGRFGMRIGSSIAVGGRRNGGQDYVITSLNQALMSSGTNVVGGGVHFYNGAAVWSHNEKNFDDPLGLHELSVVGRKVAYVAKVVKQGLCTMPQPLEKANYMGYKNAKELEDGYAILGL